MNKVILIGNLGGDPDIRYTTSGTAVANFSIATSEKRKDEKHTEWHKIVAFGRQAEVIGEYCKKGDKIAIEGRIQTRDWEDRDGARRRTTEISLDRFEFVGSKPTRGDKQTAPQERPQEQLSISAAPVFASVSNDDVPF
jgi:single-strand DNA-binding protein